MLTDNFYLETERLQIVPFDYQYLQNYAEEFTEEIAGLQYPAALEHRSSLSGGA